MEFFTAAAKLIEDIGFPAACVLGLAWFAWYMVKRADQTNAENLERAEQRNAANLERVQKRCKEREDILFTELRECREVNAKAIETIARYAEKLDAIQHDVNEIKTDVTIIMSKN
jgi:chromosome segregation ATPase